MGVDGEGTGTTSSEDVSASKQPFVPRHVAALGFIALIGIALGAAVIDALSFSPDARTAPLVIGVPVVLAIIVQLIRDVRRVRAGDATVGSMSEQEGQSGGDTDDAVSGVKPAADGTLIAAGAEVAVPDRTASLPVAVLWVLVLAAMTYVFGMIVSIPLFIGMFMRVFGREKWLHVILYAGGMTAFVTTLFVYLLGVRLYEGMLGGFLPWP